MLEKIKELENYCMCIWTMKSKKILKDRVGIALEKKLKEN